MVLTVNCNGDIENNMTQETQKAPRKFLTTTEGAKILGVTRQHLTWVLNGQRTSPGLIRRYKRLARLVLKLTALANRKGQGRTVRKEIDRHHANTTRRTRALVDAPLAHHRQRNRATRGRAVGQPAEDLSRRGEGNQRGPNGEGSCGARSDGGAIRVERPGGLALEKSICAADAANRAQ
ncbi:MAG: hypothetical protein WA117_11670 [Verrucomicrobiia bacterium]